MNGQLSNSVPILKGLFQGSVLSPWLFAIFIDDLAAAINGVDPTVPPKAFLFADDIQLRHEDAAGLQISWTPVLSGPTSMTCASILISAQCKESLTKTS